MQGGEKLCIQILYTTNYIEVILSNYIFNDYINSNTVCLFGENSPTKNVNTSIGFSVNFAKIKFFGKTKHSTENTTEAHS